MHYHPHHHGYEHQGYDPHGYFDAIPREHTPIMQVAQDHPGMLQSGESDKSSSPIQSSTTTGTTTTTEPSVAGSPNETTALKENAPVFPAEKLTTGIPENQVYLGMSPRYAGQAPEGGYGANAEENQARYNPANYPTAMKLLVSNNVAGSIIGRQGQTISELQTKSSTRIKLSQTGDYYPGTQDRVCLVQGEPANVKVALQLLLERTYMLQEHQHSQHVAWQLQRQQDSETQAFDFVVRLLVPSSSCGMIIGKSGSNIKFLEETTGVTSVRLSPKESGEQGFAAAAIVAATAERVLTVTGPGLESCVACLHQIVDGMTSHPDICRYTNMTTSYSRIMQPETIGFPPGAPRPVLVSVPPISPRHVGGPPQIWDGMSGPSYGGPAHSSQIPRRVTSSPDIHGLMLGQRQDPSVDRLAGYNQAMGMHGHFSPIAPIPVEPLNPSGPGMPRIPSVEGIHPNMSHSSSAPDLLAYQLEHSMHLSSHPPSPVGADYLVPVQPTCVGPNQFQAQVLIPDSMIGSILGRGGRTLTDLQAMTGTRIRISQRGEFLPGTRDRIVTIRGPTGHSVWQCQMMMSQRIVLPPTAAHAFDQAPSDTAAPHPPDPSQS
eukprot:scaffold15108_cov180-Amphora_coffeaeformis.AAC.50